jgi:hypothetical protein
MILLVLSSHLLLYFSSSVLRFFDQNFVCISFLPHTYHMTHLTNSPRFNHQKNIRCVVSFTKRPTVEFSSVTLTQMSSWALYPVRSYKSTRSPKLRQIPWSRVTIVKKLGLPFLPTPKPEHHPLSAVLNTFAAILHICSPPCSSAAW